MKALQERKSVRKGIVTFFILTVMMCCFAFGGETVHAADSDIVNIPDKNFKAVLNYSLGISNPNANLTKGQLKEVIQISNWDEYEDGYFITDITGIEYCTNLRFFTLYGDKPVNLSKLKNLKYLENIRVSVGCIDYMKNITSCSNVERLVIVGLDSEVKVNFSTIGNMTKLADLELIDIESNNYSMLKNLTGLKELKISVSDMTVLPDFSANKNLTKMSLSDCKNLKDISTLKGVKSLTNLVLTRCKSLSDLSQLQGITSLKKLDMESIEITKENKSSYMSAISSLVNLEEFHASHSKINDEHTSMFDNLSKLQTLILISNDISNPNFLLKHKSTLKNLMLTGNPIPNNDVFKQLRQLQILGVGDTEITDFTFVSQLPYLTNESLRTTEWNRTWTTGRLELALPDHITQYVILNDVKDDKGNYVAPVKSDQYSYNASTNRITIYVNKIDTYAYIRYEFSMTAKTGDVLYGAHSKQIYLPRYEKPYVVSSSPETLYTFLGEDVTLDMTVYGNGNQKFYWYKNGSLFQQTTSPDLVIKDVDTSDSGTYMLVVKDDYNSGNSVDVNLIVEPYTRLLGQTMVNGSSSKINAIVNGSFSVSTSASGGSGGYTYYMAMKHLDTNKTDVLQNYGTANSYKGTFTSTGNKEFIVKVKDSDGNIVQTNTVTATVYNKLTGSLQLQGITDQLSCEVGDTLTLIGSANGGSGGYMYQMTMVNVDTGVSSTLKAYSSSNSYSMKPTSAGTFKLVVTVKDSVGNISRTNKTITVYDKLSGRVTINDSVAALEKIQGSLITLKANANGGSGSYTYQFSAYDEASDKWYTLKDYSTSSSYTYKLSYTGNKKFAVTIKDSAGNTVVSNRISVAVKAPLSGKLTVGGSTAALTVNKGTSITLTATGYGGMGGYTYKFAAYDEASGKWYILKDFSASSGCSYTFNYGGKKQFAVTVKDSAGNTVATNRIYVTVNDKLSGKLTIDGSTASMTKKQGSKITLNAAGFGGSGKYTYKFVVLNVDTGSWVVLKDFSEASTYNFTCNYTGNKQFAVTVKDSTGKTVATNRITVNVTK